jgi:hypothetical protein
MQKRYNYGRAVETVEESTGFEHEISSLGLSSARDKK